jgi:hypothetical protein
MEIAIRDITGKGFYNYVRNVLRFKRELILWPGAYLYELSGWAIANELRQDFRLINEKPYTLATIGEICGESPANSGITEVIDNSAKNVPMLAKVLLIVHRGRSYVKLSFWPIRF